MTAVAEAGSAHATIVTDRRLCHSNGRKFRQTFVRNERVLSTIKEQLGTVCDCKLELNQIIFN
jgi:hypothetical protein